MPLWLNIDSLRVPPPRRRGSGSPGLRRRDPRRRTGWDFGPVNPSRGFKPKAHPPEATGVAQCVELFQPLRGEPVNRVDGARIALAHNIGGPTAESARKILEGPCAYGC